LLSFSLQSEIKQNGSEKLPSFSLRSETEAKNAIIFASKRNGTKFFRFEAKKVFFRLFSHLKRNENEIKQKQSEKTFISFRIEAKRKDRKRNEKLLESKIRSINFALVGSEKFEAKRSEKNVFFFT
jgi:hypothetical protein